MREEKIYATEEMSGERLDKALSLEYEDLSRTYIQKLLKSGSVLVNGKSVKASFVPNVGDEISLMIPDPEVLKVEPEDIPLDILYEDDDVILVNKPKGMVVHPAPGHPDHTLVNALLFHCADLSGINGVLRPGIVHRIDKDTSGVIIACKNDFSHASLAAQLKVHSITREYRAIVYGVLKENDGTVDAPVGRCRTNRMKMGIVPGGKPAVTHYHVLERFRDYTYILCRLETGRTHQIRVHMASIGHPLAGDLVYGPQKDPFHSNGQILHAAKFGFQHPRTHKYMEFEAPLPEYFTNALEKLRKT